MSANNASSTTVPIAKVIPQQQQQSSGNDNHHQTAVSVNSGQTQNVFIHARSTNPIVSNASNNLPANASFLQASGTFYYEPSSTVSGISNVLTLTTSSVTSNLNQSQSTSIGESLNRNCIRTVNLLIFLKMFSSTCKLIFRIDNISVIHSTG